MHKGIKAMLVVALGVFWTWIVFKCYMWLINLFCCGQ